MMKANVGTDCDFVTARHQLYIFLACNIIYYPLGIALEETWYNACMKTIFNGV